MRSPWPALTASDPIGAFVDAVSKAVAGAPGLFLSAGSPISLLSLTVALAIGVAFLLARRPASRRAVPAKVLIRALFPRRIVGSASTRADLGFLLFNTLIFGAMFGGALLSYRFVGTAANGLLIHAFGVRAPGPLSGEAGAAVLTVAMFLAYELGYWIDHYTSHTVPFFWEIHRVHHTATVLTPLTLFRVHPIETLKLDNILAVVMGATYGVTGYLLGRPVAPLEFAGHNVILLALLICATHLQHTQLWIPFSGLWGRVFFSPAHHQIHHSNNPADFGRNLGAYLSVWDWMFGTLRVPTARRPALTFGVEPATAEDHSFVGTVIRPVRQAFGTLVPRSPERPAAAGELAG